MIENGWRGCTIICRDYKTRQVLYIYYIEVVTTKYSRCEEGREGGQGLLHDILY